MSNPTDLANDTNALTDAEIKKLNKYLNGGISLLELGATTEIQDLASDINALTGADRVTFQTQLDSASGGGKKSHWPC